jgi:hypothetical protein
MAGTFLLTAAVAATVALVFPSVREVRDDPSPAEDPFYYVDYHKQASYRTKTVVGWGWGWVAGVAAGGLAGSIYYRLARAHAAGLEADSGQENPATGCGT